MSKCKICGREFFPRGRKLYCSGTCRVKAFYKKHNANLLICTVCGKETPVKNCYTVADPHLEKTGLIPIGGHIWCKECYNKIRKNVTGEPSPDKKRLLLLLEAHLEYHERKNIRSGTSTA